jgi:hypothetical protein
MEELAGLLSRERVLLELLLFKLVSMRQLMIAGEVRFLPWAAEEVERATDKVREAELSRGVCVMQMTAGSPSVGDGPFTLRVLAETAPEPWRTIFAEHRRAYLDLAEDLEAAVSATRRLASTGGNAVTATLDRLSGTAAAPSRNRPGTGAGTYGPGARWEPVTTGPRFIQTL